MNDHRNHELSTHEYSVDLEEGEWSSPSTAVIETVAKLSGREIERLGPLYKSVDPDSLDDLFSQSKETGADCRLSFRYQGYRIRLIGERELRLTPIEKLVVD